MIRTEFDVIVVGAGIHGVGIAQAAAAAGYAVAVLEQQAIASGSSSRSSKLIHGGLRYLEQFDLHLVHESLEERARLLKLAPELVKLVPFYIPVYRSTRRRPWKIRAGLSLYALLGGLHRHTRFHAVPRREWKDLDGLRQEELQAVFQYWDAQTDDAALTRAVMASAQALGAELLVPARFESAHIQDEACTVNFSINGAQQTCTCRVLVNAAGPWVSQVASRIQPPIAQAQVDLVQGTHLILDAKHGDRIYYVEAPQDGRAVFIMPWHAGRTLVGTTETLFKGADPGTVQPLPAEREYLLEVVHRYFPAMPTTVHASFAGLRVLPSAGTRAFQRSREILLLTDRDQNPRVLTVYGGKLTSYRADAEHALRLIAESLPRQIPRADTRSLPLTPA